MPRLICRLVLVVVLVLSTCAVYAATNPFTNPSFEAGTTAGWTTDIDGGAVYIPGALNGNTRFYTAPDGISLMTINNTGLVNVEQRVYQDMVLNAGDVLSGWAAFDARDYYPGNDYAAARIYDSGLNLIATPWYKDVLQAGNMTSTPWEEWTWSAAVGGTYRLEYATANVDDSLGASWALFDASFGPEPIPEPGTLALLLASLPAALWLRRRKA